MFDLFFRLFIYYIYYYVYICKMKLRQKNKKFDSFCCLKHAFDLTDRYIHTFLTAYFKMVSGCWFDEISRRMCSCSKTNKLMNDYIKLINVNNGGALKWMHLVKFCVFLEILFRHRQKRHAVTVNDEPSFVS